MLADSASALIGEIEAATVVTQPRRGDAVLNPQVTDDESLDDAASSPEGVTFDREEASSLALTEAPAETAPAAASPAAAPVETAVQPQPEAASARWRAEGVVFVDEGQEWSATDLSTLDAALSTLPPQVRGQLGNPALGPLYVHVNRFGRTLSGGQPYGGAANFYSTNEGRNDLVLFPGQSLLTVLHELGHAYNLRRIAAASYARVFLDPEMQGFMAASGWQVLTPADQVAALRDHAQVSVAYQGTRVWTRVSRDDSLEDFANSFALYYADPQALLKLSPERFAWFDQSIGR